MVIVVVIANVIVMSFSEKRILNSVETGCGERGERIEGVGENEV
jgi:hypothetical protein